MPNSPDAPALRQPYPSSFAMPAIDGDTRVVLIVADPIGQVKSPQLFNAFFARHGINAVLVPAHVSGSDLPSALAGWKAMKNLAGVVVTVPHKIPAAGLANRLSPRAAAIGSVNCIRLDETGGWEGDNFDGAGFVAGLRTQGIDPRDARVLLVGAGGAGTALAHALCGAGIARLDLHDVAPVCVARLQAQLAEHHPGVRVSCTAPVAGREHDIVINASPLGMKQDDPNPIDIEAARRDVVVADLVMKPEWTQLLRKAEQRGLRTQPGRHLLESAVEDMVRFLRL